MSDSTTLSKKDFEFLENKLRMYHTKKSFSTSPIIDSYSDPNHLSIKKRDYEKQEIENALKKCAGNKTKAAKELGISRSLLYDKIAKYEIN